MGVTLAEAVSVGLVERVGAREVREEGDSEGDSEGLARLEKVAWLEALLVEVAVPLRAERGDGRSAMMDMRSGRSMVSYLGSIFAQRAASATRGRLADRSSGLWPPSLQSIGRILTCRELCPGSPPPRVPSCRMRGGTGEQQGE